MHFLVKALIQNAVATLPQQIRQPAYYGLQRRFGALREVNYAHHLRRAAEIAEVLRSQGLPLAGCYLEVGTGWLLGTPVGLWLAGATEVLTVDLHAYLKEELVLGLLAYISKHESEVQALYSWVDISELRYKIQLLAACKSLVELWRVVPIRYVAPADATSLSMPEASIDYHYSTNVLEHVPPAVLAGLLEESRRVLRPGGHLIHVVDLSDHFTHDSPSRSAVHFLRFGAMAWAALAGNRFMYQNRLRLPQYQQLFAAAGLHIEWQRAHIDPASLHQLQQPHPPVHRRFQKFTPTELAVTFWVVLAKVAA